MNFACAEKIAGAARELDDILSKTTVCGPVTEKHINTLHACAINLAGDRAHEIYADENELTEEIIRLAGMGCCSGEEEPYKAAVAA